MLGTLELSDALGAIAIVLGLGTVAWWILSFITTLAGALIAKSRGRDYRQTAAAGWGGLSPQFMRRLIATLLGMNLALTPLAQISLNAADNVNASQTSDQNQASASVDPRFSSSDRTPAVDPRWKPDINAQDSGRGVDPRFSSTPVPVDLSGATSNRDGSTRRDGATKSTDFATPRWTPSAPAQTSPGLLAPAPTRTDSAFTQVVKRGENLWVIVARALGPQATEAEIAKEWPRWYHANQSVIGPDPNFLLPGQVLQAPAA